MDFDLRSDTNALITAQKIVLDSNSPTADIYLDMLETYSVHESKQIITNLIGMVIALNDMFAMAMNVDPDKLWANFCRISGTQMEEEND